MKLGKNARRPLQMNRARNQTQRQEAIEREEARIGGMGETQTLPEHTGMIEKAKRKGN